MNATAYIQDENEFDTLVANEPLLVVDVTAAWCGPCRVVSPHIDRLAGEYEEKAKVLKLDLDANKPIAKRFGMRSIPTILIFKNSELVETMVGVKTYEEFSAALEKHMD